MTTFAEVDLKRLAQADLSNEEVIQLAILYSQAETIEGYHEHIRTLRDKYNMILEIRPFEVELFSHRDEITIEGFRKIVVGLEDVGYEPLFYDILQYYQQDPNAGVYIGILNEIFGQEPNEEFCQDVLAYISEPQKQDNPDSEFGEKFLPGKSASQVEKFADLVEETEQRMEGPGVAAIVRYLTGRISEISSYAEVPNYIRHFDIDIEDLPRVKLLPIDSETDPVEIAETLINETANYGLVITEAEDPDVDDPVEAAIQILATHLGRLSSDKLEKYLAPFRINPKQILSVQEDENLFRIYGPVNPHPSDDYSELTTYDSDLDEEVPDLEKIYGGPRMFLSMEYERDFDRDMETDDWFVGHCQQCLRRIRKRHYAIRRAYLQGGGFGCYCTPECVKASIVFDLGTEPDDYKIVELDLALNEEFARLLDKIGIAERITNDEETEQDQVDDLLSKIPRFEAPLPPDIEQDVLDLFG